MVSNSGRGRAWRAAARLGTCYLFGTGVPVDYTEAAKWFEKGRNDPTCKFQLGAMYSQGKGVPQDYAKAAACWRASADWGGVKDAQKTLGHCYSEGRGVPKDLKEAYAWYALAAIDGDAEVVRWRDDTARNLTSAELEDAQSLARHYSEITKALKAGEYKSAAVLMGDIDWLTALQDMEYQPPARP